VLWTPAVLILDSDGKERVRLEGYLPREEFRAQLELALARISFMHKNWADAEKRYAEVLERHPNTKAAPEALYWKGVSHYKATNDHTILGELPKLLQEKYPDSIWTRKSAAWVH
jgi:outer membrane protein assembly factor BamD (BamD/ComL family)